MLKRIQKDKLKKYRIVALFVALYFLFTYFTLISVKPVFASDGAKPYYETSDISQDIEQLEITYDKLNTDVSLLGFLEYGYDKETKYELYSLFLYVYIPKNKNIDLDNERNEVNIAFTNNVSLIQEGFESDVSLDKQETDVEPEVSDLKITYVSSSRDNYIHKYMVEREFLEEIIDLSKTYEERVYMISDLELLSEGASNPTAYYINRFFVSKQNDNGDILSESGVFKSEKIDTHHTFYRTSYSDIDNSLYSGWQTQLSSCYFALPTYYSEEGRLITSMKASFQNEFSKPMIVVSDKSIPVSIGNSDVLIDDNVPTSYFYYYPEGTKPIDILERFKFSSVESYKNIFTSSERYKMWGASKGYFVPSIKLLNVASSNSLTENYYFDFYFNVPDGKFTNLNKTKFLYRNGKELQYIDWLFEVEESEANFSSEDFYLKSSTINNYYNENKAFNFSDYYFNLGYSRSDAVRLANSRTLNMFFEKPEDCYGYMYTNDGVQSFSLNHCGFDYGEKITKTYTIKSTETLDDIEDFTINLGAYYGPVSEVNNLVFFPFAKPTMYPEKCTVVPFVKIDKDELNDANSDIFGVTGKRDAFIKKYFIDKNEINSLYLFSLENPDKDIWLFRYDVCEYFGKNAKICFENAVDERYTADCFVGRESVYLDFDLLQFTYEKDGKTFVVPINHSPVNVFNALTGAPIEEGWLENLLKIILLILFILAVLVFISFCMPILTPILSLSLKGAGLLIKGALKIVFLPAKIIFRKRPKNDDD